MDDIIEANIDDRIRRLARGRPRAEVDELKQHILAAANDRADGQPVNHQHIDGAFQALGTDAEIRRAFFPEAAKAPMTRIVWSALALAIVIMAASLMFSDGGRATCTVSDGGSCEATSSGAAAEAILLIAVAGLSVAALVFLPTWTALLPAVPMGIVTILRAASGNEAPFDEPADIGLMIGALAVAAVAINQWRIARALANA